MKKPKALPKGTAALNEALQVLFRQIEDWALEETNIGKQARLALRLKRDGAPEAEQKRAIMPFLKPYVNGLFTPAEKLESDGKGNLLIPISMPRKKARHAA